MQKGAATFLSSKKRSTPLDFHYELRQQCWLLYAGLLFTAFVLTSKANNLSILE